MAEIDLETFQNSPLSKDFDRDESLVLADFFQKKEMDAGMTVFIENMPGESLYLIQKGQVDISKMVVDGCEQSLVKLGPLELFGELAILDSCPRSATARVIEDAAFLVITRFEYERLRSINPEIALKLTLNIIRLFSGKVHENSEEYRRMLLVEPERESPA
ncbi:MAG: cyclic nucleotide-binding domain-containing protein [Desulfuromonadales bacterium]